MYSSSYAGIYGCSAENQIKFVTVLQIFTEKSGV